ncbi:MAG: PQQ-dependent sugar dehydrogenase [Arenibacter latericius]|nr:PQQ-dependent sugar dehydrogenase [Arenibacter latericius]
MRRKAVASFLLTAIFGVLISCSKRVEKVLVFSEVVGSEHDFLKVSLDNLKLLGEENGYQIEISDDVTNFTDEILKQYSAVLFLNSTGEALNAPQKADFERYIQSGGGFVGVYSTEVSDVDWPWYNKWVERSIVEKAKTAEEKQTESLKINPRVWNHDYDGGRVSFITLDQAAESKENSNIYKDILEGIEYAKSRERLNYNKARTERIPEENRYLRTVLDFNLDEPMELDELPGRGILFIERRGALKLYDFEKEETLLIAQLPLFYGNEDGLLGLAVDPNYKDNNWIYLFYSVEGGESKQHVSRFDLVDNTLDFDSEKVLLTIPTLRKCCHSGGALEFGPDGNLFIGVGDNTNPFESSGFAPIDEREGRALWDAQRSAGNTNDLRGKILRIKPENDGTYSIPEGNLFPVGTPNARPEIYTMGLRNPFRFSIDSKTGYVYWGDVGPDAGKGDSNRGPHGMGEFNQATKAGNWGWPYTRGNNQVYNDYDFTTETSGAKFDPNNLINDSPNNTGLKELPPAQESMIWFSYKESEEFPWLGSGGVNPMGGPVFHSEDFPDAKNKFPSYFEGKLLLYEWMRDWIYVITLDEDQKYVKADPFMPSSEFSHPMDLMFGSDGSLYVLEYGQKWNSRNMDARLNRIHYVAGNRKPIARITTDKTVGAAPFTVQFSGSESEDYDRDKLTYKWFFTADSVQDTNENASYTFKEPGNYTVRLEVTDEAGNSAYGTTKILVGNDEPEVEINVNTENYIYWDNRTLDYAVNVVDKQDGSTADGTIDSKSVKVTFTYIPEGEDMVKATLGHQQNTVPEGKLLIDGTDCKACHGVNEKVNGPSYNEISKRYTMTDKAYLVDKIRNGGSGVWGEGMMSAHPQLKVEEIDKMVDYILSLNKNTESDEDLLPLKGTLNFKEHIGKGSEGKYVITASYLDNGGVGLKEGRLSSQAQIIFKYPKLQAENANELSEELTTWDAMGDNLVGGIKDGSYLTFNNVLLTGLNEIRLSMFFGPDTHYRGTVEVREGRAEGKIIGSGTIDHYNGKDGLKKEVDIRVSPSGNENTISLVFKNETDKELVITNLDWLSLHYK